MSDDAHDHDGHEIGDHDHGGNEPGRVTSPMQEFSTGKVGIGAVVLLIGLVVTFGLPYLLL